MSHWAAFRHQCAKAPGVHETLRRSRIVAFRGLDLAFKHEQPSDVLEAGKVGKVFIPSTRPRRQVFLAESASHRFHSFAVLVEHCPGLVGLHSRVDLPDLLGFLKELRSPHAVVEAIVRR